MQQAIEQCNSAIVSLAGRKRQIDPPGDTQTARTAGIGIAVAAVTGSLENGASRILNPGRTPPVKISMYTMSVEAFVSTLRALTKVIEKAAEHAAAKKFDPAVLVNARLAPDMFPLVKQVQIACDFAKNSTGRLTGEEPPRFEDNEQTLEQLKARIARTIDYLRGARAAAFEGAEEREISIPIPTGGSFKMNGLELLRDWSLPNFYFHAVTAYDILRHNGVDLGKRDFLAEMHRYMSH